jgi:hypothetical protein
MSTLQRPVIPFLQNVEYRDDKRIGRVPALSEYNDITSTKKKILENNVGLGSIVSTDDYYDSIKAVKEIEQNYYVDASEQTYVDSTVIIGEEKGKVLGSFAYKNTNKKKSSSTETHPYNLLGTLQLADPYRNGVEIRDNSQWTAGLAKITSGEKGHIARQVKSYGDSALDIISSHFFREIDNFDPVRFIASQSDEENRYFVENLFTFPIISSDANQRENYSFNGIIEPLPIREVISFFSINAPFEPRGVLGSFGNGNYRRSNNASDVVNTVDYYEPKNINRCVFLDGSEDVSFTDGNSIVSLARSTGYYTNDFNSVSPFDDVKVYPRDHFDVDNHYTGDMLEAVSRMPLGDETYVREKQKCASTGFVYDNAVSGVDSIAFGGMTY